MSFPPFGKPLLGRMPQMNNNMEEKVTYEITFIDLDGIKDTKQNMWMPKKPSVGNLKVIGGNRYRVTQVNKNKVTLKQE